MMTKTKLSSWLSVMTMIGSRYKVLLTTFSLYIIHIIFSNKICFKDNLSHHPDVIFGTDYSQKRVDKGDLVGWDLCVLATSDHSVHTYGTFGLWGSLLAGGDVVASRGRSDTLTEEDEVNIDIYLYPVPAVTLFLP